jgi:hypothetical protein
MYCGDEGGGDGLFGYSPSHQCCDDRTSACDTNTRLCTGPEKPAEPFDPKEPGTQGTKEPKPPTPVLETCEQNGIMGHCLSPQSFCLTPLIGECKNGAVCCADNTISCNTGGYSGDCRHKSHCQNSISISGLCPGNEDVLCCLVNPPEPTCRANNKYPGYCETIDLCLKLEGKTPLLPDESWCPDGKHCCVDSPICSSGITAVGTCLHKNSCKGQQIVKKDEALCPGDMDIQCCMDLPKCNFGGTVDGQCMDRDNCKGELMYTFTGIFPGDSEIA